MKDTQPINFWQWYTETAEKNGSLVSASMAARMLGTSRQYVDKLVYSGKMKRHVYDKKLTFIGMNDINKEIIKRQEKMINTTKN